MVSVWCPKRGWLGILLLWTACSGGEQFAPAPDLPELAERQSWAGTLREESPSEVRELTVALVGELRGEIQPCGCPTLPYGGFSRREVLLNQLREEGRPLFHLDAGESLLKGVASSNREDAEVRTQAIVGLMRQVGVDALAPGPTDLLALGLEGLERFVGGEPLRRVHECVFGVLALESEPVDPRL